MIPENSAEFFLAKYYHNVSETSVFYWPMGFDNKQTNTKLSIDVKFRTVIKV